MSRSSKKPTVKQIDEKMSIMAGRIDGFLHMIMQELEKHNTLILKILESMDLITSEDCSECGGTIRIPLFDGIEKPDLCPYCETPLDEKQTKLPLEEE